MLKNKLRFYSFLFLVLILVYLLPGCTKRKDAMPDDSKGFVVTTTTIIGDAARVVGGDHIYVESLMGPGIDPHLYKASAGDVRKMQQADLILYNGLHLEGKMSDVLRNLQKRTPTYAVSDGIETSELIQSTLFGSTHDPHIWFDVTLWMQAVLGIKDQFSEIFPEYRADFESNTERYLAELKKLHEYIHQRADELSNEKRILITAHDAFSYFGRAYDFQVKGLQGLSTTAEAGTSDLRNLADFIVDKQIPAIFIESSIPVKNMEALKGAVLSRKFDVDIGGELFSDSLGDKDSKASTYVGTFKHNIDTIVNALLKEGALK